MPYRTESDLWKAFVRVAGRERAQRLEVRMPLGLPDVLVNLGGGRAVWVELKFGRRLLVDGVEVWYAPRLTLEQAIWLGAWRRSGGLAGVWLSDRERLAWASGSFRELRAAGSIVSWSGTMPTEWNELRTILIGM